MSSIEVSYSELEKIGKELPFLFLAKLSRNEKKFLLSVKMGDPDFSLLLISGLEKFPAVKKLYIWSTMMAQGLYIDQTLI